jgi:hypothetical protein
MIYRVLPQQGKTLFLGVVEIVGDEAKGYLNVTNSRCQRNPLCQPTMREVDIVEMMFQTLSLAALFDNYTLDLTASLGEHQMRLKSLDGLKIYYPVHPVGVLQTKIRLTERSPQVVAGEGKAYYGEALVAEVEKIRGVIERRG